MISTTNAGLYTLQSLAIAQGFNKWIYELIKPWVKGSVLELGSGIGNISNQILSKHTDVSLSDSNSEYLIYLRQHFQNQNSLANIFELDLIHPAFEVQYKHLYGQFNTLIASNVIEHIEDDQLAITNALKLLKQGGTFIMVVPAHPSLFNRLDKQLDHYRRYTITRLDQCFKKRDGFILERKHFNVPGAIAWFITGTLLRFESIKPWQVSAFEYIVPLSKWITKHINLNFGLSILLVYKKAGS
ncbi:MAG: class I SAM-dependent methyltransferase [Saprospiraceae bacterium]|nr:class I SAM-dependent methyltransferase [Saprospiraceae bacterium]